LQIRPDIRYPALTLVGYPVKSVSDASQLVYLYKSLSYLSINHTSLLPIRSITPLSSLSMNRQSSSHQDPEGSTRTPTKSTKVPSNHTSSSYLSINHTSLLPFNQSHFFLPYNQSHFSLPFNQSHFSLTFNQSHFSLPFNQSHFYLPFNQSHFSLPFNQSHFSQPFNKSHFSLPFNQSHFFLPLNESHLSPTCLVSNSLLSINTKPSGCDSPRHT
jgi:hypothetical protein